MKVYYEKGHTSLEFSLEFVILEIGGKRIQITDDDGRFEIWTGSENRHTIETMTGNKFYLDIKKIESDIGLEKA